MFNIQQHTTESTAPSHGLYSIHGEGKEEFISAPVIQRTKNNNNQNVHQTMGQESSQNSMSKLLKQIEPMVKDTEELGRGPGNFCEQFLACVCLGQVDHLKEFHGK